MELKQTTILTTSTETKQKVKIFSLESLSRVAYFFGVSLFVVEKVVGTVGSKTYLD